MVDTLTAKGISKRFGRTIALKDMSCSIPKGSVYCIAGPNGSGKTTLINILSGSLHPDSGSLKTDGSLGYCHQNPLLYNDLTVSQNLQIFAEMLSAGQFKEKVIRLLTLGDALSKKASELSSGTRKKAELAIALLPDPDVIFLDEPTTGLDRASVEDLVSFIKSVSGKKTLIIATHQLSDLEGVATYLLVLKSGQKLFEGKVSGSLEVTYKKIIK